MQKCRKLADKTAEEDKAEQAKEEAAATVAEQKQNAVPALPGTGDCGER